MNSVLRDPSVFSERPRRRTWIAEYCLLAGLLAQGVGGAVLLYDYLHAFLVSMGRVY